MQVLEARGKPVHRGRRIALAVISVVVLVAVVGGVAYAFGKKTAPTSPSRQSNSTSGTPSAKAARELLEICKGPQPDKLAGMLDREMVRAVSDVLQRTDPKDSAVWEQWRADHFSEDSGAAPPN